MNSKDCIESRSGDGILDRQIVINWRNVLWLSLLIFVLFTRFHHLGDKPYHHDESLYAKYIWNFHVGMGYQYDPMQHGPFMFHLQQVSLFIFGINNYSMRILPASTGLFLIGLLYLIRRYLPPGASLLAGWLYAINPVFMYFQRFNREDPYYGLASVAIFAFLLMWFKDRKPWQAYASAASVSILFCIKENAFVNVFILFTFALLKVVVDFFQKENGTRLGFRSIGKNISEYPLSSKAMMFISLWGVSFIIYALANQFMKSGVADWDKKLHIYWSFIFVLMFGLTAFFVIIGEKIRTGEQSKSVLGLKPAFFEDGYVFAFCVLVFASIFIVLYTTFFTNSKGFWGGIYEWYTYWLHQHSIARIRGPFHYYHHLMLIYSFIPLTVTLLGLLMRAINKAGFVITAVASAVFLAAMWSSSKIFTKPWPFTKEDLFTNEHMILMIGYLIAGSFVVWTYIREKMFLKAVLSWWSLLAYLIYSYLQEKVPWLVMHIITPMIILAAIYLIEVFNDKTLGWRRNTLKVIFGLMVVYCLHTSFQVCWYHEADPTEQLVYVQTTYEVPKMIEEMEQMSFWRNEPLSLPIVIDGHATWPFYWYLRDWKNVTYGKNADPNKHVVVICNWEDRHTFQEKLGDKFVARKYGLRAWYLPRRSDLSETGWFREIWRWVVLRERFKPSLYGSQEICMFVRQDMAKFSWGTEIGEKPATTKRAEEPASQVPAIRSNTREMGRFGSGQGLFNEPKGITSDKEGNIYIADNQNNRIQKFAPDGKFVMAWGTAGNGEGQFDKPTGVAVDGLGNIYVADTWNHRIQKFDPTGKFIFQFGDGNIFWAPKDLIVDDEGSIYVVNTGYHRIQKFNRNGEQLWSVGTKGEDATQFTEPVGIDMDSIGRLYVADTGNKRICVYDKDGHLLRSFPVFGMEYYYSEPFISIDRKNNQLYVSDSKFNRIQIFDLDGNFKSFWGKEGSGSGEFKSPLGIEVSQNSVYVTDSLNHRVQVFALQPF